MAKSKTVGSFLGEGGEVENSFLNHLRTYARGAQKKNEP